MFQLKTKQLSNALNKVYRENETLTQSGGRLRGAGKRAFVLNKGWGKAERKDMKMNETPRRASTTIVPETSTSKSSSLSPPPSVRTLKVRRQSLPSDTPAVSSGRVRRQSLPTGDSNRAASYTRKNRVYY